jgi:peptide deformylase
LPDAAAQPRPILHYGDPLLRRRCRPFAPGDPAAVALAAELWGRLGHDGVGLAAPQIGDDRRLIVIADPRRDRRQRLVLVNPQLVGTSGPREPFEEGCLSFPGLYLTIRRPRGVRLRYHDLGGNQRQLADDGLLARIIQHEVDHLDGVLFCDRLPGPTRALLSLRLWWLARWRWRYPR